jgi:hypothetical protein
MKNRELTELLNKLKNEFDNLPGDKIYYFVRKNEKIIIKYLTNLQTNFQKEHKLNEINSQKYTEYMKKASLIEAKYSNQQIYKNLEEIEKLEIKDQEKIKELKNKIQDNITNQEKEFGVLNKEFKEVTDEAEKQRLAFNKLMNEEAKIKLWTIKEENLPKSITIGQRKIIEELITDIKEEL